MRNTTLELSDANPQQQVLRSRTVTVQTGYRVSTITVSGANALEQASRDRLASAYKSWQQLLHLKTAARISTRAIYVIEFPSLRDANDSLLALGLVRWPSQKVFDQSQDAERNGIELGFRFEDDASFSVLRMKAEQIKYELKVQEPFTDQEAKTANRLVVEFDRGLLGGVDAEKFRMDDWLKGFQHLFRRDLEKVIGAAQWVLSVILWARRFRTFIPSISPWPV